MKSLDFSNARVAFDSKSSFELFRTWLVFRICAINFVVKNCDYLYNLSCKMLGATITHGATRITVFNHFCAGETSTDILPKMEMLRGHGVGGILDYAAEAKDEDTPKASQTEDQGISSVDDTVGAPLSSKTYAYEGEAECDANTKIFLEAVRAVKDATPDGFAAIKLSGLGNPALLQRMSSLMFELVVLFKSMSIDTDVQLRPGQSLGDVLRATPMHCIDRSFKLDFDSFSKGWRRQFNVKEGDDELRRMFTEMDTDGDGLIDWLDWSSKTRLSEINELVRDCNQEGPLFKAALNDEEVKLYFNMVNRVKSIMDLAQELEVRVMVDAEWMDIQPAIDHMVLFLQRMYNHGKEPIVFNTYQTYLKGMSQRVGRDLERSRREGWRFGAKVVRGAYMVSERKKAMDRGYESPICENYQETEEEFHAALDTILAHTAVENPPPLQPGYQDGPGRTAGAEVLVASHNRGSIERVLRKMVEYNSNKDHVHFGQLMGMADHLTFTLGSNGYKAYKYVPYGPIGEVVPYLIRRTQENSTILGSDGVMEERAMVTSELRRRLNPFAR
jgi:proline dehydrogenase